MKKRNLVVFGTRPEAIKMAPLVKELCRIDDYETRVCVTAQHRDMLDQVLDFFEIIPDFDLDLMKPNQNLYSLTSDILLGLKEVLESYKPDYVFVHGDTTTAFAASLSSFYGGSKVCHIEAGLRTNNKRSPFPEEVNRQLVSKVADFHFSPTIQAKRNLLKEGVAEENIIVTGNTVVDALFYSSKKVQNYQSEEIDFLKRTLDLSKKVILVTGHRRENHGQGFENICSALKDIANEYLQEVEIVFPVHPNPKVKDTIFKTLSGHSNVKLISPLSYPSFVWLMNQAYLIITDSGGIQEEAPSIGKPVLVMRDTTERPEAVEAGTVLLVGTDVAKIKLETQRLLRDEEAYGRMSNLTNPYGDGAASKIIVDFIKNKL